jgi:pantoate--beta-alanine ligase
LLDIVKPDTLFLGQKDFQQCLVLKSLVEELNLPVSIVVGETLREASGVAMSSRNMRLSKDELHVAASIYRCMNIIKNDYNKIPFDSLINSAKQHLLDSGFSKVDYVAIANAETLQPVDEYNQHTPLVVLVAAYVGEVRLIDNMILDSATH